MFSPTVMCGNSARDWNTMPKLRRCAGVLPMSSPSRRISPPVRVSRPAIMRSKVVLPQPEGPRKHTSLPSGKCRFTSVTAQAEP
ncbi:hypothetical protein D3C86_1452770 [compost metagenome]